MGEEKGRACGIHGGGMLNRDESRRGRRFVGWREKKERKKKKRKKKKKEKSILCMHASLS